MKVKRISWAVLTVLLSAALFYACTNDPETEAPIPEIQSTALEEVPLSNVVTIYLTYSEDLLWWSSDKTNWGIVGPNSPTTMVQYDTQVQWKYDDTIESIDVSFADSEF